MDIYDEQIAYLTKNPSHIFQEWSLGRGLFKCTGDAKLRGGCLTQIKTINANVVINGKVDEEITRQIRRDDRIPENSSKIKLEDLHVFAEWQRRIDMIAEERRINKFD